MKTTLGIAQAFILLALTLNLDEGTKSNVEFFAVGKPSMLKIHGKGGAAHGKFQVDGTKVSGSARFPLDSLDTGINLRNHHMKEKYLETNKYPEAKFVLDSIDLPSQFTTTSFTAESVPFKGKLSLHGVEKSVEGTAAITRKANILDVVATFPMKITDYNIPTPGFSGITVAEKADVKVNINGPLK